MGFGADFSQAAVLIGWLWGQLPVPRRGGGGNFGRGRGSVRGGVAATTFRSGGEGGQVRDWGSSLPP